METTDGLSREKVYGAAEPGEAHAVGLYDDYPLVDPVMFQVLANGLVSTCREMGTTMMRTAYSPIFVDGLDFSCGILDAQAEMVAQAEYCPSHLNSMAYAAAWAIMEIGIENLVPGDVILHNDPYRGGTHLNDFNVMKPVFHEGEFIAIACNRAHQIDVGGRALAGFPGDADEIFQEGVICPPVRWYKGGVEETDVLDMLLANVRQPYIQIGDFAAQLASCITAERRLEDFFRRYGSAALIQCFGALQDYSERRMRAEIAAMPDGVYEFDDYADDHRSDPSVGADRHCRRRDRGRLLQEQRPGRRPDERDLRDYQLRRLQRAPAGLRPSYPCQQRRPPALDDRRPTELGRQRRAPTADDGR
jgi:N-methylhydantoinase B/oxoprolinase/acetone carboxylase alpha subunit